METILRRIGNLFLCAADTILKAKNTANSFFFDILLEGKEERSK